MSKNTKEKSFIPELGEDSNKILKSLGYSKENIRVLKKKNIT
jgi:crotonobetainyl-CoA:carnitine CoA-transferase CaiB-like acyl-CoA transferase